ncbi:class I SAM-dependent methyltransferase, partial [Candidatus Pelagibacter sp.]|nr:class I SAM-dependent methyltransferase [Candidatus Pelagibacter sp.]
YVGKEDKGYAINLMSSNIDLVYRIFKNNINIQKFCKKVVHHKTDISKAYTYIKKIKFDYIFIDGDHKYNSVKKDIYFCKKLLKLNKSYKGTLCGDDLEVELLDYKKLKFLSKKDFEKSLFQNRHKDFIKENITYHPGVTLALAKISKYNNIKTSHGVWYQI